MGILVDMAIKECGTSVCERCGVTFPRERCGKDSSGFTRFCSAKCKSEEPSMSQKVIAKHQKPVFERAKKMCKDRAGVFTSALMAGTNASEEDLKFLADLQRKGSKKEIAMRVAGCDKLLEAAKFNLRIDMFAANTILSYSSEVRTYIQLVGERFEPFPLTREKLEHLAACLKAGGYTSALCYLSAVVSTNKLLGNTLSQSEWNFYLKLRRSCAAGKGGEFRMEPLGLDLLEKIDPAPMRRSDVLCGNLAVIAIFFMLRGEEVLTMKGICENFGENGEKCNCNAHVHISDEAVRVRIASDKTNWTEKDITRELQCCCQPEKPSGAENDIHMCPVHAMKKLREISGGRVADEEWFIAMGVGEKPVSYKFFLDATRRLAAMAGETLQDDSGKQRFGTHSFRRAGAQHLAAVGWTLEQIMSWGRWASGAVRAYVLEAPLKFLSWGCSAAMLRGTTKLIFSVGLIRLGGGVDRWV